LTTLVDQVLPASADMNMRTRGSSLAWPAGGDARSSLLNP